MSKEGLEPAGCLVLQQAGKVAVQLVLLCPKDSSQATGDIPQQRGVVFNEHQNAVSHLLLFFLVNGWAGEPPRGVGEEGCKGSAGEDNSSGGRGA